jgi:RimJ/RimL family protein N-acetyltransferase
LTAEPPVIEAAGVTLVPVRPGRSAALLAGPGWPHDDTPPALGFADLGGLTWLIVDADDRVVGELGTKSDADGAGAVEIGYGLAAPSRGRGLGGRAVAVLLGWLDEQPDVRRVVARVAPGNVASRRLLERLGFQATGDIDGEIGYQRGGEPPAT